MRPQRLKSAISFSEGHRHHYNDAPIMMRSNSMQCPRCLRREGTMPTRRSANTIRSTDENWTSERAELPRCFMRKPKYVCALRQSITTQMCRNAQTRPSNAPNYPTRHLGMLQSTQYPLHDHVQDCLALTILVPDSRKTI